MNKQFARLIINCYALAFIALGLAAIFLWFKIVAGAFIFVIIGISLLRKKIFGVYGVFFVAFSLAGVGLMLGGIAVFDILHKNYKFDMLLMGVAPVLFSLLTFYFFTRREVADIFGLPKIAIIEKINKKEVLASLRVLLMIAIVIGIVLLACYLIAMFMAR